MTTAPRLTPELEKSILAAIRAGGFADVAAAAFGVSRGLFRKWLRWGQADKKGGYRAFALHVAQAQAAARLTAEMQAHQKDPRMWLRRSGPRDRRLSRLDNLRPPPGQAAKQRRSLCGTGIRRLSRHVASDAGSLPGRAEGRRRHHRCSWMWDGSPEPSAENGSGEPSHEESATDG